MSRYGNYDLHPVVQVATSEADCLAGWPELLSQLELQLELQIRLGGTCTLCLECYPGTLLAPPLALLRARFPGALVVDVATAYKSSDTLREQFAGTLTDDPVFGIMHRWRIEDYFSESRLAELRGRVDQSRSLTILAGTGAAHVVPRPDLLLYGSVTRWELQRRQRAHTIGNLGLDNCEASPALLYKNAFFLEWRMADAVRHALYQTIDYFLDLDDQQQPRMVAGPALRSAAAAIVRHPFRVAPFFDPGPWGGQWMKEQFHLPEGPANYAWCFDCVPEENSVTLGFGSRRFQLPAITLVHEHPRALLGEAVYQRFGAEFPIRFDLLDTMGGGNLSLQVHPLRAYIRKHFGMPYTQDESYYILDSAENSRLYLGLKTGVQPEPMRRDLEAAQAGEMPFPAERYVNVWPAKKHDHFSIPAGTVHCSGSGTVVLEISATPYIFTFKLWDWGRLGLDGRPRPIHLEHGLANVQWNRDTAWVERELLHQTQVLEQGPGWREERTGLHRLEFLETRRTWFTQPVTHDTQGNLHVLNLVEGEAAVLESPAFAPIEIHYAETFIVPAAVGRYIIRPVRPTEKPLAVLTAYVRAEV